MWNYDLRDFPIPNYKSQPSLPFFSPTGFQLCEVYGAQSCDYYRSIEVTPSSFEGHLPGERRSLKGHLPQGL